MKLLLHIGTDKTGSTAIQKHLYVNRSWFLQQGVYVPATGLGKDNGHGDLLDAMDAGQMSRLREELSTAVEDGYAHAVISWEGMCFMGRPDILRLARAIPADDLWLLVYLREQADIAQTGYLQEIKTGRSPIRITDFQGVPHSLSALRALLYCYSPRRNYAKLLRRWMTVIPGGQALVREYRRELLTNGNVIDDFLARFGLQADDDFLRLEQATNISLDVESAMIMNDLDSRAQGTRPRKADIFTLLSLIDSNGFGTRYFLSARRVNSIRRYYRRSNSAVGNVTGSALPQLFAQTQPCVREYTEKDLQDSTQQKRQRFESLQEIPMLFTTKVPHDKPVKEILSSGWSSMQDWGAWSVGECSEIRFRAPFWMISHEGANVIIFLKGRYRGRNTRSEVSVNGLDYGSLDLREFARSIKLPVAALQPNQTVVVRLRHELADESDNQVAGPAGPGSAFGIEKFGIQFSNPE
jgi:hypothetical protein